MGLWQLQLKVNNTGVALNEILRGINGFDLDNDLDRITGFNGSADTTNSDSCSAATIASTYNSENGI